MNDQKKFIPFKEKINNFFSVVGNPEEYLEEDDFE